MKTLIIIANPIKTSFTHALAESYQENCGNECKIVDLYDEKQEYLRYDNKEQLRDAKNPWELLRNQNQEKIAWADELVFFFPVWWGSIPAILKNYFDANFSSGFAFRFVSWKKMPEKLLIDKTAKVYCQCDWPGFILKIPFILWINIKWYLTRAILGFCGIKTTDFKLYDDISNMWQEEREEIVSNMWK